MDETTKRQCAFMARRIIRSIPGSRVNRQLLKIAPKYVMQLVEILPALLANHCVAKAEALAHEQLSELT